MTGSTNPVETSMDMQPSSLPTYRYTSTRCYTANSYIGKSVLLLLGQTMYVNTFTIEYDKFYQLLFLTAHMVSINVLVNTLYWILRSNYITFHTHTHTHHLTKYLHC